MQPCARAWPSDRGLLSASVHSESSSDPRGGRRAGARRRTPEGTRHGEQQAGERIKERDTSRLVHLAH